MNHKNLAQSTYRLNQYLDVLTKGIDGLGRAFAFTSLNVAYVTTLTIANTMLARTISAEPNFWHAIRAAATGGIITTIPHIILTPLITLYSLINLAHEACFNKSMTPRPGSILLLLMLTSPLISEALGHIALKDESYLPEALKPLLY